MEKELSNLKLFDKWSFNDVVVSDLGLKNYINLNPIVIPKTNGYYHNTPFYKSKINIVERFVTRLGVCGHKGKKHKASSGHNTGKALSHIKVMKSVLEDIEVKLKLNPILVLVKAIENSAPREEVITIERAGARYVQAVDISPQRRLDLVVRLLCQSAFQKSFNSKAKLIENLSKEIVLAYNKDPNSSVILKRNEFEKMAAAAK